MRLWSVWLQPAFWDSLVWPATGGDHGYTGDTLELSKHSLKHIHEAFVLSSNIQKILEEAEALIDPGSPLSRSRNLISGRRYENTIDLLEAELNVELKNVPSLKERARPGEEFDETYSLPIDAWQERTSKALAGANECLDRVETAWSTIVSRSGQLKERTTKLEEREDEIQIDEWLRCEETFTEWIPVIAKTCDRATETGKTDPVRALQGDMSEGERMAGETIELNSLIGRKLDEAFREIEARDGKRDPYLVDRPLDHLSERLPVLRKVISEDLEEHSRALALLETVKRNQNEANGLWQTADNDHFPNSPETNKSMTDIEKCYFDLEDCAKQLQVDHFDWWELQNNLRNIHLRISEAVLKLKREPTPARDSVRAIEAATH